MRYTREYKITRLYRWGQPPSFPITDKPEEPPKPSIIGMISLFIVRMTLIYAIFKLLLIIIF